MICLPFCSAFAPLSPALSQSGRNCCYGTLSSVHSSTAFNCFSFVIGCSLLLKAINLFEWQLYNQSALSPLPLPLSLSLSLSISFTLPHFLYFFRSLSLSLAFSLIAITKLVMSVYRLEMVNGARKRAWTVQMIGYGTAQKYQSTTISALAQVER